MARLPTSLSIGLWLVGSSWVVAILALSFDVPGEVVGAAVLAGGGVGLYEWKMRRRNGR
jgi:hypothetical protein